MYKNYSEYLASEEFKESVSAARLRSKGRCECCGGSKARLEPHHIRYCKWGEYDPPENLVMLCRVCHMNKHRCLLCGKVSLRAAHIIHNLRECDDCSGWEAGRHLCSMCGMPKASAFQGSDICHECWDETINKR